MDSSQAKKEKPVRKLDLRLWKLFRLGWKTILGAGLLLFVILLSAKFLLAVGVLRPWLDKTASEIADFPIRVNDCDFGVFGTTCVRKIDVFETDLKKLEPWLKIGSLETDVSVLRLVSGQVVPDSVVVHNPSVTLHFDEKGDLQTKLPKSKGNKPPKMPRLFLKNADFCLKQDGRPPLIIKGIEGEAWRDEKNDLIFVATLQDEVWGNWNLRARVEPGDGDSELNLNTLEVSLSRTLLESLPFVPKVTWEHVQLSGLTSVIMDLFFDGKKDGVDFKIGLEPKKTSVHIPIINLEAEDAQGKVDIDNGLVKIREVQGRAANGIIELTKAELDFRTDNYQMDYDLKIKEMRIQDMPNAWGLRDKKGNSFVQGVVAGWAKLKFLNDPVKGLQTSGTGLGLIEQAKLLGFSAKPIPLELKSSGNGFKLSPMPAAPGLLPAPPKIERHPPKLQGNNSLFFQTEVHFEDIPARDLFLMMGAKVPEGIAGKLKLDLQVGFPFEKIYDHEAYLGQARVEFKNLLLSGIPVSDFHADAQMQNGEIVLSELVARLGVNAGPAREKINPGEIVAAGRIDLREKGLVHLRSQASAVPMGIFSIWMPELVQQTNGTISFGLDAKTTFLKALDPSAWEAGSLFRIDNFCLRELLFPTIEGKLNLFRGRLDASDLVSSCQIGKLFGQATLHLNQSLPFQCKLGVKALDSSKAYLLFGKDKFFFDPNGLGEIEASASGTFSPFDWNSSGKLLFEKLTLGRFVLEKNHVDWRIDPARLVFNDAGGNTMGGKWLADAEIPLASLNTGNIKFTIQDIDAGLLIRTATEKELPVKGKLGGIIQTNFSAQDNNGEREVLFNADLNSSGYEILGIPLRQTKALVNWKRGSLQGNVNTEFAEGHGKLDFNLGSGSKAKMTGNLNINGIKMRQLLVAIDANDQLKRLDAICNLDIPYEMDVDSLQLYANGKLVLNRVSHSNYLLSDQLQGNLVVEKNGITIKDIAGNLADGPLRGIAFVNLENMESSFYKGTLTHAEMGKLFAPWFAGIKPSGKLDTRFSGKLGREITANGEAFAIGLKFYGSDFGDWRSPYDYSVAPSRGVGNFVMRDISGSVAGGKVYGATEYRWGVGNALSGNFRFQSLDMKTLQAQFSDTKSPGSGTVQGKLVFAGRDVKSLDNITANLEGTLTHSRAQGIPIVRDLVPFLPVAATGTFFDKGELKARMDRGIIRIQRLALSNALVMVLIEGNISSQGQMDLEATARTGNLSVLPEGMRNLGLKMPAIGAVPLDVISQATGALAAGILHYKITGNYKNPIVKSVPLTLLTEESLRFFFGRLTPSGQ
ncbi:MAG: hypothetical protein EBT92_10825 [Planctomycetes bacterium]|nr:hypothetical protein [Planctomycetota bacterium]